MNVGQTKSQFVAVASITAELSAVMDVAKEISLAAANAKAIAFRAGDKAKGFQPITDFINELAKETIELVTAINEHALLLYQMTVNNHRTSNVYTQLKLVEAQSKNAAYSSSLDLSLQNSQNKMSECKRDYKLNITQLLDQLAEVMHPARAARVIAANSRIEASQAGEYLQSLQAVAESVDNAAQVIHDNVTRCRSSLSIVQLTD
ncbi:MAG: chemotaxis protein [Methylococcales bacterium]|nr:chemotaxis protein [Methylococcales bacterium]